MDNLTDRFTKKLLCKKIIQETDLVKIKYAIAVLKSEFFKTVLLLLLFQMLGLLKPFLFLMIVIFPVRMCTGGIHVNNSLGCFCLSLTFALLELIFLPSLELGATAYKLIFYSSLCLICILPLAPSQKRVIRTKKKYFQNKVFALLLCVFWLFMLHFVVKDNYLIHCGIWAFFMQAIQILFVNLHNKIKRGISYV